MKRRIEQLLGGKFEYEVQPPVFSASLIQGTYQTGEMLTGFFDVTAPEGRRVRGFLYSSDIRVACSPREFSGSGSRIYYQLDTRALSRGEQVDGVFTVCSDLGEYRIPYHFTPAEKERTEEKHPTYLQPERLLELAQKDIGQARSLIDSADYLRALRRTDAEGALLLQSLLKEPAAERTDQRGRHMQADPAPRRARILEEYLIGRAGKAPVELSLEETSAVMDAPKHAVSMQMELKRSGWGYLEISVSSDASFLRPEKKQLTTDDFVGDTCTLTYIVDANLLHAGRCCGRIAVRTCYQTLYLDVTVQGEMADAEERREARVRKIMQAKMLGLYEDLRLQRIEMQAWIDRSMNVLSSYRRSGGTDVYAELFMVQLYFADGKKMKAGRMLEELGSKPSRFQSQDQYGFYLYLTTFFERDVQYVDQVEQQITEMLRRRPKSWVLQWILLYLQERYLKNTEERLEAIRTQISYGCCSPIMYLEAASVYAKDPYVLRRLDSFEKKILLYMARKNMISDELAAHVGNLAMQGAAFEPVLFQILTKCYEVSEGTDCLKAICVLLIAAGKKDSAYFKWYALGVQADLRITGLYEYYMETMDTVGIEKMPQIIRMYFSYDNSLNYHKKAAIYRDISDNRESVPQVYRQSRPQIEYFIAEQLSMGRIDSNLSILYERFLTRRMLTHTLAERLAALLFAFDITCKNPGMKSVVVVHDDLKAEQEAPLRDGHARVQIYTEKARILLVGEDGHRYASPSLYMAQRCLDAPLLITYCKEIVPDNPLLTLYFTGRHEKAMPLTLPYYQRAEGMEELTDAFRTECRRIILQYYRENPRDESLPAYLKKLDPQTFAAADKITLEELYTGEGMYEEAFALLESAGFEGLAPQSLVRICSQLVLSREYEEDERLLYYCHTCFALGKYDDNILTYLLMYYDGPVEEMKRLWNTGRSNDMDTMQLEEKILSLVLFTGTGTAGTEPIFASYEKKLGRKKMCRAYAVVKSYEYLVKNLPAGDVLFRYIERCQSRGDELEEVEELALLQYYAGLPKLEEDRQALASVYLDKYNNRGIRFAFYQKLPPQLSGACQVNDRVFLEYVADPLHTVLLYYRRSGEADYTREIMNNAFEGIFVREFILFGEETVECYTEEYNEASLLKTSDVRVLRSREVPSEDTSRYACLSRMVEKAGKGDLEGLAEDIRSYEETDRLTEKLFTLV